MSASRGPGNRRSASNATRIVAAPAVPTTLTGKKLEVPIKRLIQGAPTDQAVNAATVANPDVLGWYVDFVARVRDRLARS